MKNFLFLAIGTLVTAACLIFFGRQVWSLIAEGQLDLELNGGRILFSIGVFVIGYFFFAVVWHCVLSAYGIRLAVWVNVGVHASTQFAKYIPGNLGHHIGRAALTARLGPPIDTVVAAITLEIVMLLALLGLIGLSSVGYWAERVGVDLHWIWTLLISGISVAGLIACFFFFFRSSPFIQKALRFSRGRTAGLKIQRWWLLSLTFVLMFFGTNGAVLSLAVLDGSGALLNPGNYLHLLSLYSVAFVLGFLTPGAPAGIGIRDVILMEGLAPIVGQEHSAAIALMFRLTSVGADLLIFIIGMAILQVTGSSPRKTTQENLT